MYHFKQKVENTLKRYAYDYHTYKLFWVFVRFRGFFLEGGGVGGVCKLNNVSFQLQKSWEHS